MVIIIILQHSVKEELYEELYKRILPTEQNSARKKRTLQYTYKKQNILQNQDMSHSNLQLKSIDHSIKLQFQMSDFKNEITNQKYTNFTKNQSS